MRFLTKGADGKISHRGTEGTEDFLRRENLARRARRDGGPSGGRCRKITQRRGGRGEFFCDGKISHGGYGETEGLRVVGAEKITQRHRGRGEFFAVGKSRTEGTERRRPTHSGKYHTEAQRAQRGSRLARERDFIWMEKSRRGAEEHDFWRNFCRIGGFLRNLLRSCAQPTSSYYNDVRR